jgi:regulator of CtrA degradation
MVQTDAKRELTPRLVGALYTEAMVLADEARSYFDRLGREERDGLDPVLRVGFSCESLKVTTRLMHIIAWLLTQRAVEAGELSAAQARRPARRLGEEPESDAALVAKLPQTAQALVDVGPEVEPHPSPARSLLSRLERSL